MELSAKTVYGPVLKTTQLSALTVDFGQWSNMADHVVNPSTKFEDLTAIRS